MALQTFKLYMSIGVGRFNRGEIQVTHYAPLTDEKNPEWAKKLLREFEIELDVPEFDIRTAEIEVLEQSVAKERADSQVRVNLLLDRISQLKAITHEVAE